MDERVLEFLAKQRVSVLTTMLPDGMLHGAALHYSHIDGPLTLYFSTDKTSRKVKGLLDGQIVKAAVVIGFSEDDWVSLQLDGDVKAVPREELEAAHKIHYAKHPNSEKYKDDPATMFLAFTPKWWRYTGSDIVLSSEDK